MIDKTLTSTGLSEKCNLDTNDYSQGIKVSDDGIAVVNLERNDFHAE